MLSKFPQASHFIKYQQYKFEHTESFREIFKETLNWVRNTLA